MIDIFVGGHGRGGQFTATVTLSGSEGEHIALIDALVHADLGDAETNPAAALRDALMDGTPFVARTWPPAQPVIARIVNTDTEKTDDRRWRLTDRSALVIEGREYPIPPLHSGGGVLAPRRIVEALSAAGYRPAGNNYQAALDYAGANTIAVERL